MQTSPDNGFSLFLIIWITLGLASTAFFYLSKNSALKRKVLPIFAIGAGGLFLGFVWPRLDPTAPFSWFFVAMVVFITFLNIRSIKFCDACGKTDRSQNPFSPPTYCSKCGTKFPS